jgi:TIR domain-containing protein/pentapeptide repeat protein
MANPEHLEILKRGVEVWNKWRQENPTIFPDLSQADLIESSLNNANLANTDLVFAILYLSDLTGVDLSGANLSYANLIEANLTYANLKGADLTSTDLSSANLSGVNLSRATLMYTFLVNAILHNANFNRAEVRGVVFGNNDLRSVIGLESIKHFGPSTVGLDTLYASKGEILETFLRGCGVSDDFIAVIPSHFRVQQAIQFYSCFISYSTKDEEFAKQLYSRMQDDHLRVWFAPEDIKGGQKLHEQIERAIQIHDRLLLILSENSMQSEWVMTEIRRARKTEIDENRRKLFPITIVDFDKIKLWKCFDADSGKDLAIELREYFIPDFSNWRDHGAFEVAFDRLLRDLKAEEK